MKDIRISGSSSTDGFWHKPKPKRLMLRMALVAATVAATAIAIVGYRYWFEQRVEQSPPHEAFHVFKDTVSLEKDAPQWDYLGFAKAILQAALPPLPAPARVAVDERKAQPIFSPLPGRVEKVSVQLGETVKAGTPLLAIRSTALPDLKRDAERARSSVFHKQATVNRLRDLVALKAAPEKELLAAEQELNEARVSLNSSLGKRQALRLGRLNGTGLFWIRADGPGTVVERRALVGMEVGPEKDDALVFLAQLDEVVVIADLADSEAQLVRIGDTAAIKLAGNNTDTFQGKVEYVGRIVDPVRHTIAVRIRVANKDGRLRPNAFAQVTFPAADQHVVVVPSDAIVTDDDKSVVFVRKTKDSDTTLIHKRTVQLGRSRDGQVEVLSGLDPGEDYVNRGALLILNAISLAE